VEQNLSVPMRDGTVLRADAYLPDAGGPAPAVVSRTPYDRSLSLIPPAGLEPERATEAGFAVVVQDVRGLHGSEGEFRSFEAEGSDGFDTVEWVAAQEWCDGAVGMTGRSYPAAAQWRAAVERPPHLRAIFPVVVGSDYYDGWIYQGGAFELGFNLFWLHLMSDGSARRSLDDDFGHLPLTEVPLLAETPLAGLYREWLAHPTYDDEWKRLSIRPRYGQVEVPAFNVGGWYDIFLSGTLENFARLRTEGATEAARAGTRLLVGPWGHGSAFGPYPDHKLPGMEAQIDLAGLQLEYFERHLRGGDPDDGQAPVRIFVMGENRWRDEGDWPPPKASAERWFLHAGSLSPEPPADEPHDEYVYDPRHPAPTIGGPTSLPGRMMKPSAGPHDQRPLEQRDDVLVYTSDTLEQPLEVTGPLELVLFAATSGPDTDFVAKLCDVDAEGRSRILAEGVLRARFRDGYEAPKPVEPDRVYELHVDLAATSNVFLPGHSIRLDVTSSSHPRFDRNANSGRAPGEDTEETLTPATQRVFHDSDRASHLLLSVVRR
jgi:putative CocE/NonD family hydrolase